MTRQLHLGAFLRPISVHTAWWRYPASWPDANFNFQHLKHFAQTLERGRFDALFMADHLAILDLPMDALRRSAAVNSFDPLTVLPALAAVTERIGLIATVSTTFEQPYPIARKFASLDHISGGRAGWNIVTSADPGAALNFGLPGLMEHDERYRRAREFYDVVTGLWDSWEDDAFIHDVASGIFFDPEKLHVLNHHGPFFDVRGPLDIARPPQGWPVTVQAGASEAGRQLAAETAEVVFAAFLTMADGQRYSTDVRSRMARAGRNPDHLKLLPGCLVIVGDSRTEAEEMHATLNSLVDTGSALPYLSLDLGVDASTFNLDAKLPPMPQSNAGRTNQQFVIDLAARENLTVRQLAQRNGGYSGLTMTGTAADIADQMGAWLQAGACDGFNVMFPFLPAGLEAFVDKVVPELQRRKLFRREYEGTTLRDHLGLPRPPNRLATHRRVAE